MKVEILGGMLQPTVLTDVARVLITYDDGTPLAVACEWSPGVVITSHAGEGAQFTRTLAGLGVDRTVVAAPMKSGNLQGVV